MNDRTDVNSFGNNKFFNQDIETTTKSGALEDVRLVKNYFEIRSLIINLALYIFNNSDDEKCKTYTKEEFCLTFLFYLNEIDEADKGKIISFLRDSNEAFEDVCITRAIQDRTIFESRYNRFRQYALASILASKDFNAKSKVSLKAGDKKLTISQIALKLVYEDVYLSRENAKEIIIRYGHTSGDALYNNFIKYSEKAFRRDGNVSIKILRNKIKLIESVIELLPENKRSVAIDEVKHLQGFLVSLE